MISKVVIDLDECNMMLFVINSKVSRSVCFNLRLCVMWVVSGEISVKYSSGKVSISLVVLVERVKVCCSNFIIGFMVVIGVCRLVVISRMFVMS